LLEIAPSDTSMPKESESSLWTDRRDIRYSPVSRQTSAVVVTFEPN